MKKRGYDTIIKQRTLRNGRGCGEIHIAIVVVIGMRLRAVMCRHMLDVQGHRGLLSIHAKMQMGIRHAKWQRRNREQPEHYAECG